VNTDVPASSIAELVALAKAKPGQLNFASPGTGTPPHLAAELFKRLAGFEATHVPYKGGGQAVSDLIAGHVSFYVESLNVQLPHVKAGRLRALAVTGKQRLAALPQVPTFDEAGVSGYEFLSWVGIVAPAATPAAIVAKLNREISTILGTNEAREWFGAVGTVPGAMTVDEFSALIRSEHARWGPIVRDAGLKAE
jgi:tripartite-type tricarboxylate transporter receptor subunit TctC